MLPESSAAAEARTSAVTTEPDEMEGVGATDDAMVSSELLAVGAGLNSSAFSAIGGDKSVTC